MLRFLLLFVLAACPGTPQPPITEETDETDETESDVETDSDLDTVLETGWTDTDFDDSGPVDSDTDSDADSDTDTPEDTAPVFLDTGRCPFGDEVDCNGGCFPRYFIGDGLCDDGTTFDADFDCPHFRYDDGDCGWVDPREKCDYALVIKAHGGAAEIGWTLKDSDGVVLFDVADNTYPDDWRDYEHRLQLPSGHYTMIERDAWGDGWSGGLWTLVDTRSGGEVSRGTVSARPRPAVANPVHETQEFDVVCDTTAPTCDVEVAITTGLHGDEVGWEFRTVGLYVLHSGTPGVLGDYQTAVTTLNVLTGSYNFRMTDGGENGWEGGHVEVRHPGGYVEGVGVLAGFRSGGFNFSVDCARTATPPITGPTAPVAVNCSRVSVQAIAGADGPEVGWALFDATTWVQLAARDPGTIFSGSAPVVSTPLSAPGPYFIVPKDSIGDGWSAATSMRVFDAQSGDDIVRFTLPPGFMTGVPFSVSCTDIIPEDTAPPPPPTGPCPEGAVPDCDGVCWPETYVGDSFCDDGTTYAPDFRCAARGWDGGDCSP